MGKYKVIVDGYYFGTNPLTTGQVFEGEDKGKMLFDKPAISITYLDQKDVNVPSRYLEKVADDTPLTDMTLLTKYNSSRAMVKSITKLGGLGAGVYLAHRMKKGTWGYIGFGILGYFLGSLVGGQISNVVLKKPQ